MERSTTQHPEVEKGTLDHQLCANLHNAIWKLAWAGTAPETCPYPPPSWWEHFNPPDTIASRLSPDLIEFFKRAYYHPDILGFFYLLRRLVPCNQLLDDSWLKDLGTDRFIFLHYATNFKCGDELGLVYDQSKAKAAFVPLFDHVSPICENNYGWVPLDSVYSAYLEMIQEGKVEVLSSPNGKWSRQSTHDDFGPFRLYDYTPTDVEKSVCALKRLLDSIKDRLPIIGSDTEDKDTVALPWCDSSILDALSLQPGTFARDFCSLSAKLPPVRFRYIAPGIRIQTSQELALSLLHYAPGWPHLLPPPLLLFRADFPLSYYAPHLEHATNIFSKCLGYPAIPPGLYLSHFDGLNYVFSNGCRLVLPFGIGAAGWARLSDYEGMGIQDYSDDPQPRDICDDLYQSGYTGCSPHREVQLHKVLNSWADRVEAGDWEVGRDGVCGGIEKFKEADTPEGWKKYWVPPSW